MSSSIHSADNNQMAIVLDVGTTNIKVAVYTSGLKTIFEASKATDTLSPQLGWEEQDADKILNISQELLEQASRYVGEEAKLGITNQRESVVAWNCATSQSLSPLILWSDKRTKEYCDTIRTPELESTIRGKTGLFLTPYSSAPKIHWLLEQPSVASCADLAIGTLDSWLIFRLTGNFVTDYTNASRTMLFNIRTKQWDDELLAVFGVQKRTLPKVLPSTSDFGSYTTQSGTVLNIGAVVGDQQASMFAAGTIPGTTKVTYGTGIFPMKLIGDHFELKDSYLTTLAIGDQGESVYALEGMVENAAPRVSAVYGKDDVAFNKLMITLAQEAAPVIARLVDTPNQTIYVDGGISQNNDILAEQERLNNITVRRLDTYNGTSLGVAKLLLS